jgi:DNA-binding winged helix-turn-helix (wHTH) protein/TolB-like protein/Flp pilus assembly protein TadD
MSANMGAVRFGAFTLDISRRALMRGDEVLDLRPQSFDVLVYLVEQPGRVVPRRELLERFWPRQSNGDDSLAHCIRDIRVALGDDNHEIIKTVHRVGVRLELAVVSALAPSFAPLAAGSSGRQGPSRLGKVKSNLHEVLHQRRQGLAAALIVVIAAVGTALWNWAPPNPTAELTMMDVPSLAVLPFHKPGRQLDQDNAAGALADEVAAELLRVPRGFKLWVASSTADQDRTLDPRRAGRALGVRYVVLGSIRREGDILFANVQLVDVASGRQLWAQPFDYAPREAWAQNRVAARIARLLTDRLLATESGRPLPANPTADHHAILGRALLSGRGNAKVNNEAMALFEKGLVLDATSVPALQGYARTKIFAVLNGWVARDERPAWLDQGEAAIDSVITQEPRNFGAYRLRGSLFRARSKPDQAVRAFERAVELNPNYASAHAELGRTKIEIGQAGETIVHVETAIGLSPTDPSLHVWCFWAGQAALHTGDNKAAVYWLERAREADPTYRNPVPWLAVAYAGLGEENKGRALMAEYLTAEPSFAVSGWNRSHPRHNPVVAEQRARIETWLRELGAPAGGSLAASTP